MLRFPLVRAKMADDIRNLRTSVLGAEPPSTRLVAPDDNNDEATIGLLQKYARRLYQQLFAGDDGDRRVFLPAMIPLHAQMRELGCEGASQQRPAKRRRRSPR